MTAPHCQSAGDNIPQDIKLGFILFPSSILSSAALSRGLRQYSTAFKIPNVPRANAAPAATPPTTGQKPTAEAGHQFKM